MTNTDASRFQCRVSRGEGRHPAFPKVLPVVYKGHALEALKARTFRAETQNEMLQRIHEVETLEAGANHYGPPTLGNLPLTSQPHQEI